MAAIRKRRALKGSPMRWDLLRTFEAVARHGSLTAAAEALGVSQSTVSRHLARLEAEAGAPLLVRDTPVDLTPRGAAVLAAVRPMLDGALAARAALDAPPAVRGSVTVTAVGELVRWVLVDGLPRLCARWPDLRLRLLADNHVASLAAGEADIALRFARPTAGELFARRLATIEYGLFAAPEAPPDAGAPWLGLTGSLAVIPEQRLAERMFADRPPRLLLEDVEALGRAVAAGLGIAILPRAFAAGLDLTERDPAALGLDLPAVPARDLWLVVHRARRALPPVRAVMDWLVEVFAAAAVAPGDGISAR